MEKSKSFYGLLLVIVLISGLMTSVWAQVPQAAPRPQEAIVLDASDTEPTLGSAPTSRAARAVVSSPFGTDAAVSLVLDDGGLETTLGVTQGSGGASIQFIWLNRFTPDPAQVPFYLEQIHVLFDGGDSGVKSGDAIDLVVYRDDDGDPTNGATWLATVNATVQVANGTEWSVYQLDPPVRILGSGDVLIGLINRFVTTGVTAATYPAAVDKSTNRSRSWIGWWDRKDPPDPAVLPPDGAFSLLDSTPHPGNWMIRGYGETISLTKRAYLPFLMMTAGGCPPGTLQPDDSRYGEQWGMDKINGPRAWYCGFRGHRDVVVAVIDTGVDLEHPEFAGKLVSGWDWANNDDRADDDHGHGSHVAGIVGAIGNNGAGVAGVAWDTRIMPLKTLTGSGTGFVSWSVAAMDWAADHGADIVNLSLGSVVYVQAFQDAVNDAHSRGVLVVASAGNCGDSNYPFNGCSEQDQPSYPGAYDNVLAVASTTQSDGQSSFSTEGSYVDIAAPGSSILSTLHDGGYGTKSGTSQAAPHVAGLAALVKAAHPEYTPAQIAAAIQSSAVDLGSSGKDIQFGYGRIDAAAALGLTSTAVAFAEGAVVEPEPLTRDSDVEFAPGAVLVKFGPEISASAASSLLSGLDVKIYGATPISRLGILKLAVPVGSEWDVIESLRALPEVEYAEPDVLVYAQ